MNYAYDEMRKKTSNRHFRLGVSSIGRKCERIPSQKNSSNLNTIFDILKYFLLIRILTWKSILIEIIVWFVRTYALLHYLIEQQLKKTEIVTCATHFNNSGLMSIKC